MKKRIMAFLTAVAVSAASLSVMASADTAADGVEILSGTFENSDYFANVDAPLGIANVFHLFAFDSIELNAHCNGNFAAPNVNAPQASGTNQLEEGRSLTGTFPEMINEVSIATESISIQGTTKITDLLIPVDTMVTNANGEYAITNPIVSQLRIGGNLVDMNSSSPKYVYHVNSSYLDFSEYRNFYADMSRGLAEQDATISAFCEQNHGTITLAPTGMNVVDLDAEVLGGDLAQNGLDITNVQWENGKYTGEQSVVINVDLAGYEDFYTNTQIKIYRSDDEVITNKEDNVLDGTIVLWNFYDSSSQDGCYHGSITYTKTSLGSILAPYATINADQNVDGNIIADKIYTHAESHRCDFMGPLNYTTTPVVTTTTTPAPVVTTTTTPAPVVTTTTTPAPVVETTTTTEAPVVVTSTTTEAPAAETTTTTALTGDVSDDEDSGNATTTTVADPNGNVSGDEDSGNATTTTVADPNGNVSGDEDSGNATTTTVADPNGSVGGDEDSGVATTTTVDPALDFDNDSGNATTTAGGNVSEEGDGGNGGNPITGEAAPIALVVAIIATACVITLSKKDRKLAK